MYKVTWEDGRPYNLVHKTMDVDDLASKIGTDGAVVEWLSKARDLGVIQIYSTVIAYITYQAEDLKGPTIRGLVLQGALQQYDRDDLVVLCEEYDKYVQESTNGLKQIGDKPVMDLLTYIACVYKNKA